MKALGSSADEQNASYRRNQRVEGGHLHASEVKASVDGASGLVSQVAKGQPLNQKRRRRRRATLGTRSTGGYEGRGIDGGPKDR